MSIRTINFNVEADRITPSTLQRGGLQGEHNATELVFKVDNSLVEKLRQASMGASIYYRFEGHTGIGLKNSTLPVVLNIPDDYSNGVYLDYLLENWLTREGGNITVYLIFSVLSKGETLVDIYSYPARLKLEAVPDGKYTDGKNYESIAKLSVAAEDAAERAESAAEISEAAKEQTVDARFALENGAEFIFLGGDASGAAEVDLVVDGEMSDTSNNPVSNKVIKKYVNNMFDLIYPVGSIYMSANDASPSILFGGEWERIKDRFLLSCGDTYAAGSTGGEAEHTLSIEEMPTHDHILNAVFAWRAGQGGDEVAELPDGNYKAQSYATTVSGGSKPHNNIPPYLAVYMWQRIG